MPQMWMIYLKVCNARSIQGSATTKRLPMFCNTLYVSSLKDIWNVNGNGSEKNYDGVTMSIFCDQFVDVCLLSTDIMDPDQLGIVSLLDHLEIFDKQFWVLSVNADSAAADDIGMTNYGTKSQTFTNCLASLVNRVGITSMLMGVYNCENEGWNGMGE